MNPGIGKSMNTTTAATENIPNDKTEDEKLNDIVIAAAERIKARRTFNDGWTVLKDPGEAMGGTWKVGTVRASLKEFSEAFGCKPWMNGRSVTGCTKDMLLAEFCARDPQEQEWNWSCELRLSDFDARAEEQVTWNIKGTGDAESVGHFLCDRFGRFVMIQNDEGSSFGFYVTGNGETPVKK